MYSYRDKTRNSLQLLSAGKLIKKTGLFLLLLFYSIEFQVAVAADLSYLEKILNSDKTPTQSEYLEPVDVVSQRRYRKTSLTREDFTKARGLYAIANSMNLSGGNLSLGDFERVVLYVKAYRSKKHRNWFHKAKDKYVHPDESWLKVPVHFLSNGHVYIHFKNFDPSRKKGGYKVFSRSIDFDTGDVYANLVVDVMKKKDGLNTLAELEIMDDLRAVPMALSFRDVSIYTGHSKLALPGSLVRKISIQAALYDHDLGVYYEQKPALLHSIWLTLKAARSLRQVHEKGYVHRDVKPGNFFIRGSQGSFGFVIADFGLSEHYQGEGFGKKLSGTRGYMAPEICDRRMRKEPSFRTLSDGIDADVFSLGMTFWSLLKGRRTPLRSILTELNGIALPKDKSITPDRNTFNFKLNTYKKEYKQSRPSRYRVISVNDQALYSYESALWQLLTPEPEKRITLDEFISDLEEVLDILNVQFVS